MGLPPFLNQNIVRTLAHLAEFFALGFTASVTSGAFLGFKKLSFILAVAVSSLTSVTDEYIQLFSEGRAFQFKDLLVDNTGIILGSVTVFLGIYVFNFLKNRRGKNDKG